MPRIRSIQHPLLSLGAFPLSRVRHVWPAWFFGYGHALGLGAGRRRGLAGEVDDNFVTQPWKPRALPGASPVPLPVFGKPLQQRVRGGEFSLSYFQIIQMGLSSPSPRTAV